MAKIHEEGSEEARRRLPALLERAHRGKPTVITKRGAPYAVIMPVTALARQQAGISIRQLRGSGKSYWGKNAAQWIESIRGEWE